MTLFVENFDTNPLKKFSYHLFSWWNFAAAEATPYIHAVSHISLFAQRMHGLYCVDTLSSSFKKCEHVCMCVCVCVCTHHMHLHFICLNVRFHAACVCGNNSGFIPSTDAAIHNQQQKFICEKRSLSTPQKNYKWKSFSFFFVLYWKRNRNALPRHIQYHGNKWMSNPSSWLNW